MFARARETEQQREIERAMEAICDLKIQWNSDTLKLLLNFLFYLNYLANVSVSIYIHIDNMQTLSISTYIRSLCHVESQIARQKKEEHADTIHSTFHLACNRNVHNFRFSIYSSA